MLLCIDSARLMTSSLSNLVNNISAGSHKIECKHGNYNNKCETWGIKYKYCNCFLNIQTLKMILLETNVHVGTNVINTILTKSERNDFSIHTSYLTKITMDLFYCCKKLFNFRNMLMIVKI